jgi:protein TonB
MPSARQLLASKNIEIARLTAELERKTLAYAKRPKRKAISASTREYKYAAYLDAWRRKVERIGNLNYPDQAKRNKLYGDLVLHVAVKADGSVEQIRVLHSSGHKILDDAAVRIVRLAAPFSPFPNEIRKETDILDITRTWQFLRSGKIYAE